MRSHTFLPSLEALVISEGHNKVLIDPWPPEYQVIGRISVDDMERSSCLDGTHY